MNDIFVVFEEVYYKELAHAIMEAEKSRPRRSNGVSSSLSPRAGEDE